VTTEQRESAVASPDAPQSKPSETKTEMTDTPDLTVVRDEASKKAASDERNRIREISVLCERHQLGNELKETLISDGTSIGETRKIALDKLQAKPVETVEQIDSTETNDIGYRGIEDSMSYLLYGKDHSRGAGAASEVSEEVLKRGGVQRTSERSVFIPYGALAPKNLRATYNTGASGTGGALVGTDYLPERFIETLQATSSVMAMGVTVLPGLVGDVSIPKRDTDATAYWLTNQTTAITQSESTFSNVSLTPKRVAAYSKWSMQTEQQALPAIEELSRRNLITKIDQARDLAILNGSGSGGQPEGVLNTTGIGNIALGTNGGSVSLNNLIDLEGALSEDNALTGSLGYIAHSKIINQLKKARAGGSTTTDGAYLWNSNLQDISRGSTPGSINGYSIRENNLLPTNLTKGSASTCTPIIFGNFSDIYVGMWGAGIEVSISETEDDFIKLLTSIRAVTTMDVAVAHAQSFAAIKDALS
jgi:HK97 family phage major capsid protein